MTLTFEPISLERQTDYLSFLQKTEWEASDYSFVNLWGWANEYGLEWAWTEDLIWIRQSHPARCYWAPVGDWKQADWPHMMDRFFTEKPVFVRVPEKLVHYWKSAFQNQMEARATEDHWDYVYAVSDLIALKGNRFHKKKNLLNQFKKKYEYQYRPLDTSLIGSALDMQESWCTWRDCESDDMLAAENRAISRVLENWEALDHLIGGSIYVDNQMVAFSLGERMDPQNVLIHFEKGLTEYKGIYQAINQMFLAENASFETVNREPDMGEEGLRKAKRSYNPVRFVQKYQVSFK